MDVLGKEMTTVERVYKTLGEACRNEFDPPPCATGKQWDTFELYCDLEYDQLYFLYNAVFTQDDNFRGTWRTNKTEEYIRAAVKAAAQFECD